MCLLLEIFFLNIIIYRRTNDWHEQIGQHFYEPFECPSIQLQICVKHFYFEVDHLYFNQVIDRETTIFAGDVLFVARLDFDIPKICAADLGGALRLNSEKRNRELIVRRVKTSVKLVVVPLEPVLADALDPLRVHIRKVNVLWNKVEISDVAILKLRRAVLVLLGDLTGSHFERLLDAVDQVRLLLFPRGQSLHA